MSSSVFGIFQRRPARSGIPALSIRAPQCFWGGPPLRERGTPAVPVLFDRSSASKDTQTNVHWRTLYKSNFTDRTDPIGWFRMATARQDLKTRDFELLTERRAGNALSAPVPAGQFVADHFRCAPDLINLSYSVGPAQPSGYFRFGPELTCYGQCASGIPQPQVTLPLHDVLPEVTTSGSTVQLPFDPCQVVDNLRWERYARGGSETASTTGGLVRNLYYFLRPLMPVAVRQHLQRMHLRGWDKVPFPSWPVDRTADRILERLLVFAMKARGLERIPFIWFWPDSARSCAIVTHDVETATGRDFCTQLMDLNDSFGIKTSFQIIPEQRYAVKPSLLEHIRRRGFEVNIHDLNHDGHLFDNKEEFERRVQRINEYGEKFGAQGFRSAVLYRNEDWFDALDFSYEMSIPNVAHLDPQRGGCCTVLPYFIGNLLELPLTMTQDYSLFHILSDYSMTLWEKQMSLIREGHGLISFNIHPDYIIERKARGVYTELLQSLSRLRSEQETWLALPGEVAAWWRQRQGMKLVSDGRNWRIDGPGCERATLAYAVLAGDSLTYEV